jgi:CheY-like chemotaxis protein
VKKVLVVEDSKLFSFVLNQKVRQLGDFEPVVVHTYGDAKKALETETFFAAILDMVVPGGENGEVLELTLAQKVPSIVLTSRDDKAFKEHISSKDIVDYVIKESNEDIAYAVNLLGRIYKNRKIKVLVVDDSKTFQSYVSKLLKLHLFDIRTASDGEEGLKVLESNPDIKMVLTDYNMPKMDGLAFTKALRRQYKKDTMAVIVLSANEEEGIASRFLKFGANDYIKKPFSNEEFFSRVYLNIENIEHIRRSRLLNRELRKINQYHVVEQKKARHKQKNIVVNELQDDTSWSVNCFYKAADILSGDSYSIHKKEDGSIVAYLIDGMGHGILPSLTTFAVAAHIRQFIGYSGTLQQLGHYLLDALREILDEEEQLSYSIFHISPDGKRMDYSIGGMYPAMLQDGKRVIPLKANSLPILNFSQAITINHVEIESFKQLLIYSDGLIEDEHSICETCTPENMLYDPSIYDKVVTELADKKTEDDVTILSLKRES